MKHFLRGRISKRISQKASENQLIPVLSTYSLGPEMILNPIAGHEFHLKMTHFVAEAKKLSLNLIHLQDAPSSLNHD